MARRPSGQLYRNRTKDGWTYGVRFRWNGKRRYRTIGHSQDGWTKKKAEVEIERLMAALWAGAWEPEADRRDPEPEPDPEPTFEEFVMGRKGSEDEGWFERRCADGGRDGRGLSPSGEADLARACDHLRLWFGPMRLSEITVEEVERFAHAKRTRPRGGRGPASNRPLSPTSVRRFVRVLRAILAETVRWGRIPRNPADGVKVKAPAYRGTFLDKAEQLQVLLEAAGEIDGERRLRRGHGRALLATLALAGLRIDEALSLRWRDVDLAAGTLRVLRSKTYAGEREVDLLPLLRDELTELKARRSPDRAALVFGTSRGGKESASNVRSRLLRPAAERASAALEERGRDGLPKLTPHSLRRTFATFLVAAGDEHGRPVDPLYLADQLGHEDPTLSLKVYAQVVRRKDGEPERIRALVQGTYETPEVPTVVEGRRAGLA
jgi:integrase